jgi:hypothetical protein
VSRRHIYAFGERFHIERLGIIPVNAVANAPQLCKFAQVLGCGLPLGHLDDPLS